MHRKLSLLARQTSVILLTIACVGAFTSCGTTAKRLKAEKMAKAQANAKPKLYDWRGDDLEGDVAIEVSLTDQKAYITIGGQDAGWTYLASGRDGHLSPLGSFKVTEKIEDKHSNLYGVIEDADGNVIDNDAKAGREEIPPGGRFAGAPMPYWMRLTNYGVGLHAGFIPNPGHPASHGCFRLPIEMAEILFDVVKVGTPVIITGSIPKA